MINIISFGFKYGIPKDVDLMVDVRFLPNPYFVPDLKNLTGEDEQVKNFVFSAEETQVFLEKYCALLDYLIPLYKREGKSYLTIGIGCTGGRHRSVALSSALHDHILEKEKNVRINHRDISQPQS